LAHRSRGKSSRTRDEEPSRFPACRGVGEFYDRGIVPDVLENYPVDATLIPVVDRVIKIGRPAVIRIVGGPKDRTKRPSKVNELRPVYRLIANYQRSFGLDYFVDFLSQVGNQTSFAQIAGTGNEPPPLSINVLDPLLIPYA